MKVKYNNNGDTHEENVDKYGDVIYKQKDCKLLNTECENVEHWIHEPSNKILEVPITLTRHWKKARQR